MEATGVGRAPACRAVVVDITSAEQARLDLRENEERLRMVLAAANMGVWEWERKTGDIYWSPECFRIFGVDRFCPTLDSLVHLLHPEDAARIKSIVGQMLIDGKEKTVEFRIIRPTGKIAWIRSHGKPLCNDVGKPLRLLGLVQDIGERWTETPQPAG
jgi:PAS domain S-box-containing protein